MGHRTDPGSLHEKSSYPFREHRWFYRELRFQQLSEWRIPLQGMEKQGGKQCTHCKDHHIFHGGASPFFPKEPAQKTEHGFHLPILLIRTGFRQSQTLMQTTLRGAKQPRQNPSMQKNREFLPFHGKELHNTTRKRPILSVRRSKRGP